MNKISRIKNTINSLRARIGDAATTEAEVVEAVNKMQSLMDRYGITEDDLKVASSRGDIVIGGWSTGTKKIHTCANVATSITILTETRGWISTVNGVEIANFMGFSSDVEYALYLMDLTHNAAESEWEAYRETDDYASVVCPKQRARLRPAFMSGMLYRIQQRIRDICGERSAALVDSTENKNGTSVVVLKRELIAEEMENRNISVRKRRKTTPKKKKYNVNAYFAGRAAAEGVTITTGITS